MKIVVINGTEVKGRTYHMKENFLSNLRDDNDITEFYLPKNCPHFCTGCKVCFTKNESFCPHAADILPIWSAIQAADVLIFAYPVYASRAPGQVKSLLDHLACHHMAHRPDPAMFKKRAVILTQSGGSSNKAAQKDVAESLIWMGISEIMTLGFAGRNGADLSDFSAKHRTKIEKLVKKLASGRSSKMPGKSIKVKILFSVSKTLIRQSIQTTDAPNADARHWLQQGWISDKSILGSEKS